MSSRHSSSRRQSYGRRQKDLRGRRGSDLAVDLEGPGGWSRGREWDGISSTRDPFGLTEVRDGSGAR
jgi:hypothetical protein